MESVIRGLAIYIVMMVIMRFSGRRTLGEMTPFDFVLLLIIAETTQQALLGEDFSLTNAFVLIVTLVAADIALSYLKDRYPALAKWIDGQPTVLIRNGEIDARALRRSRVGTAEILQAARQQHGLERIDQVKFAILEVNGGISIVPLDQRG